MDYQKVYNNLIEKAKDRVLSDEVYRERHHIIPRCMGGTDNLNNLVELTAKEHYVAHLLLSKANPLNAKLAWAAIMMAKCSSSEQVRFTGRIYQWAKTSIKESSSGENNSQFGTCWIYNRNLRENKKIKISEIQIYLDQRWLKGRVNDFDNSFQTCRVCGCEFLHSVKKFTCGKECRKKDNKKFAELDKRKDEFLGLYIETGSSNLALKKMGLKGSVGYYYQWSNSVLREHHAQTIW